MARINVSRRGFFARLMAACGWLAMRTTAPASDSSRRAASMTTYRYDDLGRLVSVTQDVND